MEGLAEPMVHVPYGADFYSPMSIALGQIESFMPLRHYYEAYCTLDHFSTSCWYGVHVALLTSLLI
jgi:hypothetical protein